MNLLFVVDSYPPRTSGAGWATYNLVNALKKRGHKINVVNLLDFKSGFGKLIYTLLHKYHFGEFLYIFMRSKIKKILKEKNIDLVVATHLKSVMACNNINKPFVSIIHDYWPICFSGTMFNKGVRCTKCDYKCIKNKLLIPYIKYRTKKSRRILGKSKIIFFNHGFTYKKIANLFPNIPKFILPNLIPTDYKKTNFGKGCILFVGKAIKLKGIDLLLEIAKKLPNEKFIMIGFHTEGYKDTDNLKFIGRKTQKETLGITKNAKALINLSIYTEGPDMVIQEALSVGTPVILSKRKVDIVKNGKNGFLVEPNVDSFVEAIKKIGSLKFKKLKNKNKEIVNLFEREIKNV